MADPVIKKLRHTAEEVDNAVTKVDTVIDNENKIDPNAIPSGAITGPKLGENSVTTGKIAPGTIEARDINQSAFDSTLQEKGKLAEAKVVGDKFKEQGDSINDLALKVDEMIDKSNGIVRYKSVLVEPDSIEKGMIIWYNTGEKQAFNGYSINWYNVKSGDIFQLFRASVSGGTPGYPSSISFWLDDTLVDVSSNTYFVVPDGCNKMAVCYKHENITVKLAIGNGVFDKNGDLIDMESSGIVYDSSTMFGLNYGTFNTSEPVGTKLSKSSVVIVSGFEFSPLLRVKKGQHAKLTATTNWTRIGYFVDDDFVLKKLITKTETEFDADEDGYIILCYSSSVGGSVELSAIESENTDYAKDIADIKSELDKLKNGETSVTKFVEPLVISMRGWDSISNTTASVAVVMDCYKRDFDTTDEIEYYCKYKIEGVPTAKFGVAMSLVGDYWEFNNTDYISGKEYIYQGTKRSYKTSIYDYYGFVFGLFQSDGSKPAYNVRITILDAYIYNKTKGFYVTRPFRLTSRSSFGVEYKIESGNLINSLHGGVTDSIVDERPLRGKMTLLLGDSIVGLGNRTARSLMHYSGAALVSVGHAGFTPKQLLGILTGWSWCGVPADRNPVNVDAYGIDYCIVMMGSNGDPVVVKEPYLATTFWDLPKTIGDKTYNTEEELAEDFYAGNIVDVAAAMFQYWTIRHGVNKFYLVSPPPRGDNRDNRMQVKMLQLQMASDYWGIPFGNGVKNSGLCSGIWPQFANDRVHPEYEGGDLIGAANGKALAKILS